MKLSRTLALVAALILGVGSAVAQDLGAGGGEPGKALIAHFDATRSGEVDRVRAEMHPENHAQLDEMIAAGEADMILGMMKMMTPDEITITGGRIDGDSAEVEFTGSSDGDATRGSASLGKVDGRWLVKKVKMSN